MSMKMSWKSIFKHKSQPCTSKHPIHHPTHILEGTAECQGDIPTSESELELWVQTISVHISHGLILLTSSPNLLFNLLPFLVSLLVEGNLKEFWPLLRVFWTARDGITRMDLRLRAPLAGLGIVTGPDWSALITWPENWPVVGRGGRDAITPDKGLP